MGRAGGATRACWERMHTNPGLIAHKIGARTYVTGLLGDGVMGNWWDDPGQVAELLYRGQVGKALQQTLAWSKVVRITVIWLLLRSFPLSWPPSLAPTNAYRPNASSQ